MLAYGSALFSGSLCLANEGAVGFDSTANCVLVVSTAIVVGLIVTVAALSRNKIGLVSTGMGAIFEYIYDFVTDMSVSMMGPVGKRFVPFCMSIFLFVLISNWSGLLPIPYLTALGHNGEGEAVFECPTTSFSTTLAMAFVSFFAVIFYGMRKYMFGANERTESKVVAGNSEGESANSHDRGYGVIKGFIMWWTHFLHPTPMLWRDLQGILRYLLVPLLGCLFVVLNVIEETARLASLSIRLYGNLFGEHTVKGKLLSTMQDFLAMAGDGGFGLIGYGIMAFLMWVVSMFMNCIGTLAGFIQAYVFFVLTLSYISHVATDEH